MVHSTWTNQVTNGCTKILHVMYGKYWYHGKVLGHELRESGLLWFRISNNNVTHFKILNVLFQIYRKTILEQCHGNAETFKVTKVWSPMELWNKEINCRGYKYCSCPSDEKQLSQFIHVLTPWASRGTCISILVFQLIK